MAIENLYPSIKSHQTPIGVVGLGYVGLPLACLLASKYRVLGFDISKKRVDELRGGFDRTNEVEDKELLLSPSLRFTTDPSGLKDCGLIIVTVPTPVDQYKKPDLRPIQDATRTIAQVMRAGTIVVYESTVYPGITETDCRSILEEVSGLTYQKDFFLGYSPERVNPGDRLHTIDKICKVVAGSTPEVTETLASVYSSVIDAGVFKAASIMTAEAAKVIENTQRDINIALINELSQIFERIGLDTLEVLEAARTKWNFLDFRPGLVGGHCIGVDPYYLTHLSESVGIHPQVILAGRHINDNMGRFVAEKTLRMIMRNGLLPSRLNVVILGVTFKENVPDLRNTKVLDMAEALQNFGVNVFFVDPVANEQEFEEEYGKRLSKWEQLPICDAAILAVKHDAIVRDFSVSKLGEKLRTTNKVIVDIKGILDVKMARELGVYIWRP